MENFDVKLKRKIMLCISSTILSNSINPVSNRFIVSDNKCTTKTISKYSSLLARLLKHIVNINASLLKQRHSGL